MEEKTEKINFDAVKSLEKIVGIFLHAISMCGKSGRVRKWEIDEVFLAIFQPVYSIFL